MRALRFAKELYRGEHVDEALKLFERYGTLERAEEDDAWVVKIEAGSRAKERRLAGEIANYALGLTVQHRGTA